LSLFKSPVTDMHLFQCFFSHHGFCYSFNLPANHLPSMYCNVLVISKFVSPKVFVQLSKQMQFRPTWCNGALLSKYGGWQVQVVWTWNFWLLSVLT